MPSGPTPRRPAPPSAPAKRNCATYEINPDERKQSLRSAGAVGRSGTFGKVLTLSNFGAGQNRMKRQHEDALRQLIRDFDLTNPQSDFEVEFIRGFTDAVDSEDKNEALRRARADDVQFVLKQNGVPGAPDGTAADVASYDNGCTPATHSLARRVVVQVHEKAIRPTPTPEPKAPPEPAPPNPPGKCNPDRRSTQWALQSVNSKSNPSSPGVGPVFTTLKFLLIDTSPDGGCKHVLQFAGAGAGAGASMPTTFSLPSPTPFTSSRPLTAREFEGGGAIRQANVGIPLIPVLQIGPGFGLMKATLHPRSVPEVDASGFQLSGGIDTSLVSGTWKLLGVEP